MTYRHITNLFTPFDTIDQVFLDILSDYRVGDPVKAGPKCNPVKTMKENGVVGIYTTLEARNSKPVLDRSGWDAIDPAKFAKLPGVK